MNTANIHWSTTKRRMAPHSYTWCHSPVHSHAWHHTPTISDRMAPTIPHTELHFSAVTTLNVT